MPSWIVESKHRPSYAGASDRPWLLGTIRFPSERDARDNADLGRSKSGSKYEYRVVKVESDPNIRPKPVLLVGDSVIVDFFDSMTMRNRQEQGVVTHVRADEMVDVEVEKPIRKRVTVPIGNVTKAETKTTKITQSEIAELVDLYHLARTATGSDKRYDRLIWAAAEFNKKYPDISKTKAYIEVERATNPMGGAEVRTTYDVASRAGGKKSRRKSDSGLGTTR